MLVRFETAQKAGILDNHLIHFYITVQLSDQFWNTIHRLAVSRYNLTQARVDLTDNHTLTYIGLRYT